MFESKNDKMIDELWNKDSSQSNTSDNESQNEQPSEEVKSDKNASSINSEPPKQEKDKKQKTPWIQNLVIIVLCGGLSGFGGGYAAVRIFTPRSVVFQNAPTEIVDTVQTDIDGLSVSSVYEKAQKSVVEIRTERVQQGFIQEFVTNGAGSGVIITSDGYIVTNNHVIDNAKSVSVILSDGKLYSAEVIGKDPSTDLAVVKIDANDLTPAVFGNSENLKVGETAIAIGNPLGTLGGSVTNGIISALDRELTIGNETMTLLQTNAAVNPGNSGGGLFNINGELIGIVNAKSIGDDIEGLGFAIPINDVKAVVEQLINVGYVSNRATIGVYLSEVTQSTEQFAAGLYITEVIEGSGAADAGLKPYDRIIFVGDSAINSYSDLKKLLKDYNVGDTISMTVVREGKQVTVDCKLSEAKQ